MTAPRTKRRRFPISRGTLGDTGAPFAQVLALGSAHRWRRRLLAGVLVVVAYSPLSWIANRTPTAAVAAPAAPRTSANVTLQPLAPPPPPPAPPPPARHRAVAQQPEPAAAATAAHVVARDAAADGPMDMTSFSMPEGTSSTYAGGYTAASGIQKTPVSDASVAPNGKASEARDAAPGRTNWACDWPEAAQQGILRDVRVTVVVHVDRDGQPTAVDVSSGPPEGFAEAARTCAMHETYRPAHDDAGESIPGRTPGFIVHFVR